MSIYVSKTNHTKIVGLAHGLDRYTKECFFWEKSQPIFDLLEKTKPKAIFLTEEDVKDGHIKYAKHDFPNTKFILCREKNKDLNLEGIDLVLDFEDETSNRYVPFLGNEIFMDGLYKKELETDLLVISNGLDDNDIKTNRMIASLGTKFRLKIYGDIKIPAVYYLGRLRLDEYRHALKSAKIIVLFSQEWFYDAIANNTVPLVYGRNNNPWNFNSYAELTKKCEELLANDNRPEWFYNETKKQDITYSDLAKKIVEELKI